MSTNFEAILLEYKLEKMGILLQEKQYTGIKTWTLSVMPKGSLWLVYLEKVTKSESVNHSVVPDFATPWTVAWQASLSLGFSRQEYWSGLPFPSPGDLPNPGIKFESPALQADSLPSQQHKCLKGQQETGSRMHVKRQKEKSMSSKKQIKRYL